MDDLTECVVRLAAAVGARRPTSLEGALDAAEVLVQNRGPRAGHAIDEVLLQSILFVGYPAGLDALAAWRRRVPTQAAPTAEDPESWAHRGEQVCRAVYGAQYERLRNNIRALHPDAERWMISDGYGRVLGRPGLELVTRELAIVAQLAVIGAHRQLFSHALGALRVGASTNAVAKALEIATEWIQPDTKDALDRVWAEVQAKASAKEFSHAIKES